jgi:hypothetical protein
VSGADDGANRPDPAGRQSRVECSDVAQQRLLDAAAAVAARGLDGPALGIRTPASYGLTWSDSGFGTPRSVVMASSVDWNTNRSHFGLARNRAAAAIGSADPGPARRARDSSTAARAVLTTWATMIGAVEWSSAAARRSPGSLGPWTGFGLLCLYTVIVLGLAAWRLRRREV